HPRPAWKHLFEPFIRQSAGLGKAPKKADADRYEHFYWHTDILIVGGGVAGLQAALTAAETGLRITLVEQTAHWGGRAPVDGEVIDGQPADDWVKAALATLAQAPNVTLRPRLMGAGVYDHGYVLGYERVADHSPESDAPRHRLWKIRAKQIITATGAIERPLSFPYNDVPGVMLASAVRDYAVNFGVAAGQRSIVVTNNDDAYLTALALHGAGQTVPLILDARPTGGGALADRAADLGIRVRKGAAIAAVRGRTRVQAVTVAEQGKEYEIACDCVAMSGGWSPVVHLWSHCGGKLTWNEGLSLFQPDLTRPPTGADGTGFVTPAGIAAGSAHGDAGLLTAAVLENATKAAAEVCERLGRKVRATKVPAVEPTETAALEPVWVMPRDSDAKARSKMWLDFQNDVKVSDVQLAAQEGFESVEHTKRYTTLGMATDQGKLSNINGLAVLSKALDAEIPQVGTTTFRPPYTPISMGAIAGEARGETFQPLRRTPMHDWHEANGAHWEPVGHWRRPYCYLRGGETTAQAVAREVQNTRAHVGLLDASTLGKILLKGPDAGKLVDMLYTNKMSTLKPGRCRYGLMCNENGFLSDDGVVARLDDQTFLCHTTSGGADRIHGWIEDWLQTEWWDWQVYAANLTEQYAQVAVVGPKARTLLERLGGSIDLGRDALPFMGWAAGTIGDFQARIFRISFSGELSYEVAVPAGQGAAFWERLLDAGEDLGVMPYGTEALHVMRAEKGFIMIGDETDGTVIPQDLGLHWAISGKKPDYLGKRAQARSHLTDDARWRLVGLETVDGSVLPDGAYAVSPGHNENGQRNMIGRVTSTYHSPTLGKGIALGLVQNGPDRMGDLLDFPGTDGKTYQAKIVDPVFYDPDGEKQNA
ncbi:MAG: glycine cleavage T C-terminal barrel domain-containing protein, partial [Pseudomonadota bacterium]